MEDKSEKGKSLPRTFPDQATTRKIYDDLGQYFRARIITNSCIAALSKYGDYQLSSSMVETLAEIKESVASIKSSVHDFSKDEWLQEMTSLRSITEQLPSDFSEITLVHNDHITIKAKKKEYIQHSKRGELLTMNNTIITLENSRGSLSLSATDLKNGPKATVSNLRLSAINSQLKNAIVLIEDFGTALKEGIVIKSP